MSYCHTRILIGTTIDAAEMRVREALSQHGFGVLTEIDVRATMEAKLGREMGGYRILGACNPGMAWQAIQLEPRVGVMLPCNVILRETADGTEIAAVDPEASMSAIENSDLLIVAGKVRDALVAAVESA